MEKDKIIMYDSPEAGRFVTVQVWEVDNPNGKIYTHQEHTARWNNCTHMKCDCGGIRPKSYTICENCIAKKKRERYNALPFEEWDLIKPVVDWDGDEYFFDIDTLNDYMYDNEIEEIELLVCEPIHYRTIDSGTVADDSYDEWEPTKDLEDKIEEFNKFLKTLPPHSWRPGKIRTSYKLPKEQEV